MHHENRLDTYNLKIDAYLMGTIYGYSRKLSTQVYWTNELDEEAKEYSLAVDNMKLESAKLQDYRLILTKLPTENKQISI